MTPATITANSNHATVERLSGFSIRENAGTPAVASLNLRKLSVSGQILFVLELAANESASIMIPEAVSSEGGVYVQVIGGAIEGVLWTQ
jgi:hypothetical protein